jgi:hypothetical protein
MSLTTFSTFVTLEREQEYFDYNMQESRVKTNILVFLYNFPDDFHGNLPTSVYNQYIVQIHT